jgi:release factor glutamine methyltransferase
VARLSADWLAPGGRVLLELGGDQAGVVAETMEGVGLSDIRVHRDRDGDDRAIEGRWPGDRSGRLLCDGQ